MSVFGSNVYKYRKIAGLSQKDLAIKLNYTNKSSIGKIENGNSEVTVSMAMKIADALNVDIMRLLHDGTEKEKPSDEFSPYIDKAEEWKLEAVRKILDMPPKKICRSEEEIV